MKGLLVSSLLIPFCQTARGHLYPPNLAIRLLWWALLLPPSPSGEVQTPRTSGEEGLNIAVPLFYFCR